MGIATRLGREPLVIARTLSHTRGRRFQSVGIFGEMTQPGSPGKEFRKQLVMASASPCLVMEGECCIPGCKNVLGESGWTGVCTPSTLRSFFFLSLVSGEMLLEKKKRGWDLRWWFDGQDQKAMSDGVLPLIVRSNLDGILPPLSPLPWCWVGHQDLPKGRRKCPETTASSGNRRLH